MEEVFVPFLLVIVGILVYLHPELSIELDHVRRQSFNVAHFFLHGIVISTFEVANLLCTVDELLLRDLMVYTWPILASLSTVCPNLLRDDHRVSTLLEWGGICSDEQPWTEKERPHHGATQMIEMINATEGCNSDPVEGYPHFCSCLLPTSTFNFGINTNCHRFDGVLLMVNVHHVTTTVLQREGRGSCSCCVIWMQICWPDILLLSQVIFVWMPNCLRNIYPTSTTVQAFWNCSNNFGREKA